MNNTLQVNTKPSPGIPRTLVAKVALVTGASSGIGRAAAIELARRGAKVVVSARRTVEIENLADTLKAEGLEATAVRADITREAEIAALVSATVAAYGRIDIAFNNAGTEGVFAPFAELEDEHYDLVFEPNVRGVFNSMRHEAKAMLAQGVGVIINNASAAAVVGFPTAGLYAATKHAVLGLTKTAALEWFPRGVRVNAICPGMIDTAMAERITGSAEAKDELFKSTVAGRGGTPEEVGRVVAFLASDDASFVSGHSLIADGGYTVS